MSQTGSSALRRRTRHLALGVALLTLAFLFMGDRLLVGMVKSLNEWGRTEASTATLETLLQLFPSSEHAAEGLLYMAKMTPPVRPDPFVPRTTFTGDLSSLPGMVYSIKHRATWGSAYEGSASEKIGYLERLLEEFPDSTWRMEAIAELGFTFIALGRYEEAAQWMQQAWNHADYAATDPEIGLYLAQAYLNMGDLDRAMETLVETREKAEEVNASPDLLFSIALAFENLGAYEQAYELATSYPSHFGMTNLRFRLNRTFNQMVGNGEPPSLIGVATMNGESLAGVRIVLVLATGNTRYYPATAAAQAITDANGRFELYGIPPGTYQIALALPAQMARESSIHFEGVLDTMRPPTVAIAEGETTEIAVRFERSPLFTHVQVIDQEPYPVLELAWEEDPRAAFYRIGLIQKARISPSAEITMHAILADINAWTFEAPEARISLEELYRHSTDHPRSTGLPEGEIDLTALLGFRHPDVSAHFYVQPIGADGELLGNSQGEWDGLSEVRRNLATVELPSRRTVADELLLQRNYDAAIAAYKEQLEQNPNDLHSLYVLWALHTYGTDHSGSHQDLALGKHYGERLLELMENRVVRDWVERSLER